MIQYLHFHTSSRRGENSWNQNINAVVIFGQCFFFLWLLFCFISGGMKESEFWFTDAKSWLRSLREIQLNVIYFHFCTTKRLTTMRAQLVTHIVLCWKWHLMCQHPSVLSHLMCTLFTTSTWLKTHSLLSQRHVFTNGVALSLSLSSVAVSPT